MKRIFVALLVLIGILLVSCDKTSKDNTESSKSDQLVTYSTMNADWPEYNDPQSIYDVADLVFTGKVVKISFQLLDSTTAKPPTSKTEDIDIVLFTIYDIEIIENYKGNLSKTIQVKNRGGIKDEFIEEQLDELKKKGDTVIPLMEGMPEITIGKEYLFVVKRNEDRPAFLINLDQSVFSLDNPFEEHPHTTAKDIISVSGKENWNAFWEQWQKDNPNWESKLDKDAVEKALNE